MEGSGIDSYVSNQERSSSIAPEESGWTVYFDDLLANRKDFNTEGYDDDALSYSSLGTPSLVSDAASCAPWNKVPGAGEFGGDGAGRLEKSSKKKLGLLKKQRRSRGGVPEELEDTASSPVNSPKVGEHHQQHQQQMKHFEHLMNNNNSTRKNFNENSIQTSSSTQRNKQQGTSMSGHCSGVMQKEEWNEHNISNQQQNFFIGRENDCTELKKKGLCVVPLSMLVNYYG